MRIMGIDPGMALVGYGVIEIVENKVLLQTSGSIRTEKDDIVPKRLAEIMADIRKLVELYSPDVVSIEDLFFFKNQKTIIPVAQARGVILAVIDSMSVPIYEYTPMQVKQVLTGYGRATKKDVEEMVRLVVTNKELPKLDDTVDAIAIAICHANCAASALGGYFNQRR